MVANPKSLSARANFTTPPTAPPPNQTVPVDVTFTLSGSNATFTFDPSTLGQDNVDVML